MTITLTSHAPFNIPEEYRELNLESELNDNKLGGYIESVHYTDKQIGMFMDLLDEEGILENSIVVFMGDHTGIHKYSTMILLSFQIKRNGSRIMEEEGSLLLFTILHKM